MHPDAVSAAAFTVYVRHNMPLFTDGDAVRNYESILLRETQRACCDAFVYVFMPSRCHLLLQGRGGQASFVDALKGFRQAAGYWLSKVHCDVEWSGNHGSDPAMTQQEIREYARHMLNAPVRTGLVDDWKQYRYKGSTLYQLESLL